MHYNTGSNPRVTFCDIDSNWNLAIDPDTMFWALISKNKDLDVVLSDEVFPMYEKYREELANEMNKFRFETNLSAVYVNPTDRCNANCTYCYLPKNHKERGLQMNGEQLRETMTRIEEHFNENRLNGRKPVIVFHGSEPLLVKDLLEQTIEEFRDTFHFGIQSNALELEEDDTEFIRRYGINIGISLDSHIQEINDSVRRVAGNSGTYEKAVKAIDMLEGYEGLNVVTTITNRNVKHLPGLVEFLYNKKVPAILMNPVRGTQKSARQLRPESKDLTKYFIAAVEKACELSKKDGRQIIIGDFANILLGIVAPLGRRLMCDITPCGGGRCFFAITADGRMFPCGEFIDMTEFYAGNIFKTPISEAMESKAFKNVRSRIVEKIEYCSTCAFRNICGAPCPAEVYSEKGDLNQRSPYCEFYEELIRYAFKVIAEDKLKYHLREEALNSLEYKYSLIA
jgi:uncharacterized protein